MTKATDILDELDAAADEESKVTIGAVTEHLGHRGTGALLMVPAALELTPVGGIPGVPTVLAVVISLFAVQILFGRSDMWLPGVIARRGTSNERVKGAVEKLRGAARWSDRHLGRHFPVLTDDPAPRVAAVAILGLCATVPMLEFVPFASSIPMGTIVLFGLAMVVRDGRVMALAWLAFAAACWGVWTLWP